MSLNQTSISSSLNFVVWSLTTLVALCFMESTLAPAIGAPLQDAAAESSDTGMSGDSLDALLSKWSDLESQMGKLESDFKASTDPAKQDELRGQYKEMIAKANETVVSIKSKALEAFNADASDAKTARLLVGILKNDAEFSRYDDAVRLGDKLITGGIDGSLFETAAKSGQISITTRELLEELYTRNTQRKTDTLPQVKVETSKGEIVIELFEDEAPNTVANFVSLVEDKFYDGLKFHRVIEGFVAQGGDPEGNGSGGPGYSIACECYEVEARRHYIGSLSMAHAGKDSGGSQFFICLTRTENLNELHTVFGRVISGLDVLDRLSRNFTSAGPIANADTDIIKNMVVVRKRDHEYKPVKNGEEKADDPPPVQPETMKMDDKEDSESAKGSEMKKEEGGSEPASEEGGSDEKGGSDDGDDG